MNECGNARNALRPPPQGGGGGRAALLLSVCECNPPGPSENFFEGGFSFHLNGHSVSENFFTVPAVFILPAVFFLKWREAVKCKIKLVDISPELYPDLRS